MAFKKIPLTIDTMIRNPVPIEGINQEDNVELNIVVTENKTPKDLSSQTIKVYVRRIDGTLVEQTDQITPTNASKGEVTVKLKNSAFNKEGYALFQLDVSDSIGRITSSYATFKIGKGLVSGEVIANTNEIEALKKVEEYIKKANQELETFKQTVAEINENEATRQENEVVRVREEASRDEAEALREKAEATRVQQELVREEKEGTRVEAEQTRVEKEEAREISEQARIEAEATRVQQEQSRVKVELTRVQAETKREEKEKERKEAEARRVADEETRRENEILRESAELERKQAEELRKEAEATREGRLKSLETEVTNARTATTGEDFNSLDERIDAEVDRINKKVEFSFMQQEDAESHKVENTIVGMTTDMVVKGKTMYKKSDGSYTSVWEEGATLESFGEQEENKISISSKNKNLFNKETDLSNWWVSNGVLYKGDSSGRKYSVIIDIIPGVAYTKNVDTAYNICAFLGEKDNVLTHNINNTNTTPSAPKNAKKLIWYLEPNGINKELSSEIQIEMGVKSTKYQPYKEDKKDILLPFTKGLKSVNTTHDEINSISKKIIQRIGERSYEIGDEDLETVITDKTTTYYILDEPIEHELSSEINASTYDERTYVDFENVIKGTSSFKAPVNTLKTIARLNNENTRLKRDLALHAEKTTTTDEAITDYSLDMDYKLCLLEMELTEIKKQLGGK